MPWTRKQLRTAQAVAHGWHPTGKASGFTRKFAEDMLAEQKRMRPKRRKHKTIKEMMGK